MRLILLILTLLAPLAAATTATAQSAFDAAIRVNGEAITYYELDQRQRMLRVFNTPGDLAQTARDQLIEERLKMQEAARAGGRLSEKGLRSEMERFAERANLTYPQFLATLQRAGVAEETLRDFVRVGVTWRELVRGRYQARAQVSDGDVARAAGTGGAATRIDVLLSEIIIPMPPQRRGEVTAIANQISRMSSTGAFEAAARKYSALPSRTRGGRLGWLPLTNYPAGLHGILLDLKPGEVTAPIPITNAIALFQMRGTREVSQPRPAPTTVEYLTYALPKDADPARLAAMADRCDDVYGLAKGQPADHLRRQTVAPSQIPTQIATALAGLDMNEATWGVADAAGRPALVMLCARTFGTAEPDTDALRNRLIGQRLSGFADALLAELRASARIEG